MITSMLLFIRIMGALMAKMMAPYTIYNIQYKMFIKLYTLYTSLFFGFG